MSLADAIRAGASAKSSKCTFATMYRTLSLEDQTDLDACMADEDIQTAAIARGLNAVGIDIKGYTVARHRNGECRCETR